jgi:hypothetical protein
MKRRGAMWVGVSRVEKRANVRAFRQSMTSLKRYRGRCDWAWWKAHGKPLMIGHLESCKFYLRTPEESAAFDAWYYDTERIAVVAAIEEALEDAEIAAELAAEAQALAESGAA